MSYVTDRVVCDAPATRSAHSDARSAHPTTGEQ
jgi:hypothetical protein